MMQFNHLRRIGVVLFSAILFFSSAFSLPFPTNPPVEQPFEGIITYQHVLKTKNPVGMTYRSSKFFIKGGMYRSEIATNDMRAIEIYTGQDSLFTFAVPSQKCMWWSDVRNQKDAVVSSKIQENAATVMGVLCHVLTVQTTTMTLSYYFHPDKFKANSALFQNHKLKHWNTCLEKTKGSLPLKIVYEYADKTIEMEAITAETKKLDRWFFKPPYEKTLVKTGL